jgi:hypothetical protein
MSDIADMKTDVDAHLCVSVTNTRLTDVSCPEITSNLKCCIWASRHTKMSVDSVNPKYTVTDLKYSSSHNARLGSR